MQRIRLYSIRRRTRSSRWLTHDKYAALLAGNPILSPAGVMYRRVALEAAGGFDASFDKLADYELNLRIARQFQIRFHREAVADTRLRSRKIRRARIALCWTCTERRKSTPRIRVTARRWRSGVQALGASRRPVWGQVGI